LAGLKIPNPDETVLVAYLRDISSGEQVARWVSWPEPLKYVHMSSDLKVTTEVVDDGSAVIVRANAPVKGVVLSASGSDGKNLVFDNNFIDLVPDEEVRIGVTGLVGDRIDVRFLYDWELEPGFEL
jgi:beta-mannosidase